MSLQPFKLIASSCQWTARFCQIGHGRRCISSSSISLFYISERVIKEPLSQNVDANEMISRKLPIIVDELVQRPSSLLNYSTKSFLPPHVVRARRKEQILYPGHHMVYFPLVVRDDQLMEDGTDILHAPNRSWNFRLWTGGSIDFTNPAPIIIDKSAMALVEKIEDVRITGNEDDPERVQVKLLRKIGKNIYGEDPTSIRQRLFSSNDPSISIITETRNLMFFKSIPKSFSQPNTQKRIPPPSNPTYTVPLKPTRELLFRFSALTFNAHAIHLDKQYTKDHYGLPDLVVHGPLTLVLMLEVIDRAIYQGQGSSKQRPAIRKIEYKNIAPLFVNEEMTICCKKVRDVTLDDAGEESKQDGLEEWQVWIQKQQAGELSLAVRATVLVQQGEKFEELSRPPKNNVVRKTWAKPEKSFKFVSSEPKP